MNITPFGIRASIANAILRHATEPLPAALVPTNIQRNPTIKRTIHDMRQARDEMAAAHEGFGPTVKAGRMSWTKAQTTKPPQPSPAPAPEATEAETKAKAKAPSAAEVKFRRVMEGVRERALDAGITAWEKAPKRATATRIKTEDFRAYESLLSDFDEPFSIKEFAALIDRPEIIARTVLLQTDLPLKRRRRASNRVAFEYLVDAGDLHEDEEASLGAVPKAEEEVPRAKRTVSADSKSYRLVFHFLCTSKKALTVADLATRVGISSFSVRTALRSIKRDIGDLLVETQGSNGAKLYKHHALGAVHVWTLRAVKAFKGSVSASIVQRARINAPRCLYTAEEVQDSILTLQALGYIEERGGGLYTTLRGDSYLMSRPAR